MVVYMFVCLSAIVVLIAEPVSKKTDVVSKESTAAAKARQKAQRAKKAVLRGRHLKRSRKIRTSVHFHRPKTLCLPRSPMYPRKSAPRINKFSDVYLFFVLPCSNHSFLLQRLACNAVLCR